MPFSRKPLPREMRRAGLALQLLEAEALRFDIISMIESSFEADEQTTRERFLPAEIARGIITDRLSQMEATLDVFNELEGTQGFPLEIEKRVKELRMFIGQTRTSSFMTGASREIPPYDFDIEGLLERRPAVGESPA